MHLKTVYSNGSLNTPHSRTAPRLTTLVTDWPASTLRPTDILSCTVSYALWIPSNNTNSSNLSRPILVSQQQLADSERCIWEKLNGRTVYKYMAGWIKGKQHGIRSPRGSQQTTTRQEGSPGMRPVCSPPTLHRCPGGTSPGLAQAEAREHRAWLITSEKSAPTTWAEWTMSLKEYGEAM